MLFLNQTKPNQQQNKQKTVYYRRSQHPSVFTTQLLVKDFWEFYSFTPVEGGRR